VKHTNKSINEGHRKRLKERFLQSGLEGFLDYEIIELLLTLGTPRKDCKQPAKDAISKFINLTGVLNASIDELQQVHGIGPLNAIGIKLFQALIERYSKEQIDERVLLDSPIRVFEYLREKIGRRKKECIIVLCLDSRNKLIEDEVSVGTLNASLVHPREVFSKAVLCHASHVVVAHNHPSGDPTPSEDDILTTHRLIDAGKILGIRLVDHIIVARNNFISLKDKGII
jgi:DNA repair protein RadC